MIDVFWVWNIHSSAGLAKLYPMRQTRKHFHPTFKGENVLKEGVFQVADSNNDILLVTISLLNPSTYLMNSVSKCESKWGLSSHHNSAYLTWLRRKKHNGVIRYLIRSCPVFFTYATTGFALSFDSLVYNNVVKTVVRSREL